ncbi:hypothetical protein VL21_20120 [Stenotrophomonas maltophilia]|nr:hypothetical protein VL21_20120 [Stenotrophomonas maltophilia]
MNAVKQGNAVLESYGYNHCGERVLRSPAAGAAQITLYDEAGQWLGNYSATGQAQQQAIWLDNYPVALINTPATGVPELAYVQPDHLGTPRVVIDPVRNVSIWEWSNKSEVFGNQIPSADPDGDGVAFDLVLRFPGQQTTDANGLFYNYQREYDPAAGRYSQSDPIGLLGGIASFAYAGGNPISQSNSLGLCEDDNGSDAPIHQKTYGKYFKSCMSYVQPPTWLTLPVSGASVLTLFVEVPFVAGVATVGGGALASYEVGAAIVCAMAGIQTLQ